MVSQTHASSTRACHRTGEGGSTKTEVPTLQEFAPRFVDGYARANRQKPSGIAAKETILDVHLIPQLGTKRLDAITSEDVQHLKSHLRQKAPKTVNNVLTVLNALLKQAVEWNVIARHPCTIRLLPIHKGSARFHDFDEYERLVAAAKSTDAGVPDCAVGGRRGSAVRRDDGVGMDRRRPLEAAALRPAVGLEGTRDGPEGRPAALCAAHDSIGGGAARPSASSRAARAVRGRRPSAAAAGGARVGAAGGTSGQSRERRRACAATHVLFTPGDAGRAGAERFRNSRGMAISARRSATCT